MNPPWLANHSADPPRRASGLARPVRCKLRPEPAHISLHHHNSPHHHHPPNSPPSPFFPQHHAFQRPSVALHCCRTHPPPVCSLYFLGFRPGAALVALSSGRSARLLADLPPRHPSQRLSCLLSFSFTPSRPLIPTITCNTLLFPSLRLQTRRSSLAPAATSSRSLTSLCSLMRMTFATTHERCVS